VSDVERKLEIVQGHQYLYATSGKNSADYPQSPIKWRDIAVAAKIPSYFPHSSHTYLSKSNFFPISSFHSHAPEKRKETCRKHKELA
jgi:hypothetical protein